MNIKSYLDLSQLILKLPLKLVSSKTYIVPFSVCDGLTNIDAAIRELTRGREREMDRDSRHIKKDGRMIMKMPRRWSAV